MKGVTSGTPDVDVSLLPAGLAAEAASTYTI